MKIFTGIKTIVNKIPWFYILLSFYPLLFLWSNNKTEIDAAAVLRPLIFTFLLALILYAILYLIFRDLFKAALYGSLMLILFYSYGQVYTWIREITGDVYASRHRILGLIYAGIFLASSWGIYKRGARLRKYRQIFNIVCLVLILVPISQLGIYYISSLKTSDHSLNEQSALHVTTGQPMPDVYYIILDTYMRSDALKQDMGFDNQPFIQELQQMGFYVASCSQPNYDYTQASIATSLNMEYLPDLQNQFQTTIGGDVWAMLKNNEVRHQLESVGYTTVAFVTTYKWSEWDNADVYLGPGLNMIGAGELLPFEAMYLKSTAVLLINDMYKKIVPQGKTSSLTGIDFPYQYHVDTEQFILNQLPNVSQIPGHKFVFVHILIPHVPYVFSPDGEILTDPGFFSGKSGDAINDEYRKEGYLGAVQFINNRIVPILQKIIHDSKTPPIIILQGDHGFRGSNRQTILNAYYFPKGYDKLYPSISPVNSFRIVLDQYFGANYPLLVDQSFTNNTTLVSETYSDCLP
jgi:hypothetical protein